MPITALAAIHLDGEPLPVTAMVLPTTGRVAVTVGAVDKEVTFYADDPAQLAAFFGRLHATAVDAFGVRPLEAEAS